MPSHLHGEPKKHGPDGHGEAHGHQAPSPSEHARPSDAWMRMQKPEYDRHIRLNTQRKQNGQPELRLPNHLQAYENWLRAGPNRRGEVPEAINRGGAVWPFHESPPTSKGRTHGDLELGKGGVAIEKGQVAWNPAEHDITRSQHMVRDTERLLWHDTGTVFVRNKLWEENGLRNVKKMPEKDLLETRQRVEGELTGFPETSSVKDILKERVARLMVIESINRELKERESGGKKA